MSFEQPDNQEDFDKKQAEDEARLKIAYSRVFNSEDGLLVLHELLEFTGLPEPSCPENTHLMYFQEGMKSTLSHILDRAGAIQSFGFGNDNEKRQEEAFDE